MNSLSRSCAAVAVLLSQACARPLPPPLLFVDSEAFSAVQGRAYGRIQGDLDADGVPETVLLEKVEIETQGRPEGRVAYAVRVYRRELGDQRWVWSVQCETEAVVGEELDTLRWVDFGSERLLFVMASESNPDRVRQSFALIDPASCERLASDVVALRRPGFDVIAPEPVPGGVFYDEEVGIRIVDEPRVLRLHGTDGDVELLVGVHERRLTRVDGKLESVQGTRTFLRPVAVRARWLTDDTAPVVAAQEAQDLAALERPDAIAGAMVATVLGPTDLPELGDVDEGTAFAIRGGEAGALELTGADPLLLIEIHHGCGGAAPVPLGLSVGGAERGYITGTPPVAGSFVRAAGRSHAQGDAQRDLLALRDSRTTLRLSVAADPVPRCVREVRGFGFAPTEAGR